MKRFTATLEPVSHGGHYVAVPGAVATALGVEHSARVRGEVRGAPFRSSLAKYSGVLHLGIPKAALAQAGAKGGERVQVSLEADPDPRPEDEVPEDLARALVAAPAAALAWERLRPSHRREHVKAILEAKRPETRARRIEKALEMLLAGPRGR